VAIGISSSSILPRGAGAEYARSPAVTARPGAREPRGEAPTAPARTGNGEDTRAQDREPRLARVERIGVAAASGGTARGIAAYLGVERGAVTDSVGGELVGIDFYI